MHPQSTPRPCMFPGCELPHCARGLCNTHYAYWRRHGHLDYPTPPSEAERFWSKVNKQDDGCWRWVGAILWHGYGVFSVGGRKGRQVYAHRYAYEAVVDPIPDGLYLDHLCRNRWCVNPDHLEPVTMRENLMRGQHPAFVAHRNGTCTKGHGPEHQATYRNGKKYCRVCTYEKRRARWLKERYGIEAQS